MKESKKKQLYRICECAVFIALSVALSYLKIEIGAFGGSIDFVMIPLFIIAYRNGLGYGVASGLVFGLIKCLIGGGIGWGLPSVLLDYVLAYGAVGVAGIFKEKSWAIELSTFVGCAARYVIHFISGVTILLSLLSVQVTCLQIRCLIQWCITHFICCPTPLLQLLQCHF